MGAVYFGITVRIEVSAGKTEFSGGHYQKKGVFMKKSFLMTVLLLGGMLLGGAELKFQPNAVAFGSSKLNIYPSGIMNLTDSAMYTSWYLHFTTEHPGKWFAMSGKACSPKVTSEKNGSWNIVSSVPVSETEKMNASVKLTATSFNTIEIECSWDEAQASKVKETGFFVTLPVKLAEGKAIRIAGKDYPVVNETRFGWFHKTLENPEIVLFPGTPREYTLTVNQKCDLVIGSVRDGGVTLRINALSGAKELNLTFAPK